MINLDDAPRGTSVVYFLMVGGNIKIGFTRNLKKRIKNHKTHTSLKIEVLGFFRGSRKTELDLHAHFHDLRVTGEWFRPSADLLAFIDMARAIEASGAIAANSGTDYGFSEGGIVSTARRAQHDRVCEGPECAAQNGEILVRARLGSDAADTGRSIQNSEVRDTTSKSRHPCTLVTVNSASVSDDPDPQFVSVSKMARILDRPTRTVRGWCEKGQVLAIRSPGGVYQIPRAEIDRVRRGDPLPATG